jgi:hypothetical protein
MGSDSIQWLWADKDAEAVRAIERRLASAARSGDLITYSDLVRGLKFTLAKKHATSVIEIDTSNWSEHERAVLSDYLGYVSLGTYREAGFLASALAVQKDEMIPSRPFFEFAKTIGALQPHQDQLQFWAEQVAKAQAWYRANPDR